MRRRPRWSFGVEPLEPRRLPAVSFGVYALGANEGAGSLATDPQGNLWFTGASALSGGAEVSAIGELNPGTGAITSYPVPDPASSALLLLYGPDGDFWFVEQSTGQTSTAAIASINPTTHAVADYPFTIAGGEITDLTVGPDGNLWFSDFNTHAVGVFSTTAHTFAEFGLPNLYDIPEAITGGPDGNVWFGVQIPGGEAVGDIDLTTHAIVLTDLTSDGHVRSITSGTDGNLWFNLVSSPYGRFTAVAASINPTTRAVNYYTGSGAGNSSIGTGQLAIGPDGNIWFGGTLGEFDQTTHVATSYAVPGDYIPGLPTPLAIGPDGTVWTTNGEPGSIFSAKIIPSTQAAIAGYVYLNPTGGAASSPLVGQTVYLDLKGDGQLDPGAPTINTTSLGYYSFTGLTPGTYTVRVAPYPGNIVTSPSTGGQTVTVSGGQLGSSGPLGMIPSSSLSPLPYNPSPFGADNPDVQTAEVTGLYNLVLGHAPDPVGMAYWVQALRNGVPVSTLSNYLLSTPEYDTDVILADYRNFLDDPNPTVAAVNEWVGFMQAGMTAKQAAYYFMTSDVFDDLFPSNTAFVQALYVDVLGYQPASWEVSAWLTVLGEGVTRSQAVTSFLDSSFSDTRVVTGLYGTILVRQVDSYSLTAYVSALEAGWTPVQIATLLFSTPEFAVRANATVA